MKCAIIPLRSKILTEQRKSMKKFFITSLIALLPLSAHSQSTGDYVGGLVTGENYQDLLTAFPGNAVTYDEDSFSLVVDLDLAQETIHNCSTPNLNLLNDKQLNSSAVVIALNYDLQGNTIDLAGRIEGMRNNNSMAFVVAQDRLNGRSYWYEITDFYKAAGQDDEVFRVEKTNQCGENVQNGLSYVPVYRDHNDLDSHYVSIIEDSRFRSAFSLGFRCYENKKVSIGSGLFWNVFLVAQKQTLSQPSDPIKFKSFKIAGKYGGFRPYAQSTDSLWPSGCSEIELDSDNDGVPDNQDNCPTKYNPSQTTFNDLNFLGYEDYYTDKGIWCDCDAQWITLSVIAGNQPWYILNDLYGDGLDRFNRGLEIMPTAFWTCSQPD